MGLTHVVVDDLLARLARGDGHAYLPAELDPHGLAVLLADRYGTPRTLVLDGVTDPTVDESGGAALLAPFRGRAVTIRAWAHGEQWIGTGTARDAEGVQRTVLVVARRELPELLTAAPGEAVDWVERLVRITGRCPSARRACVDWAGVESRLGVGLPGDYKRMVEVLGDDDGGIGIGVGIDVGIGGCLGLDLDPSTYLSGEGLLIWGSTEREELYCWRTDASDPDRWPVVVHTSDSLWGEGASFGHGAVEFVCRILADPYHRFGRGGLFPTPPLP